MNKPYVDGVDNEPGDLILWSLSGNRFSDSSIDLYIMVHAHNKGVIRLAVYGDGLVSVEKYIITRNCELIQRAKACL